MYQRNNKAKGIKSMRCFPACCESPCGEAQHHVASGRCGRSIVAEIRSEERMPLVAIAYLCPKKAHAEHAQDDGFGHIRLRAGDKLSCHVFAPTVVLCL